MPTDQPATTEQRFRRIRTPRRDDAQIGYLVDLLSDDSPGNRWKAAQALGRTQDPAAVDALLRAIYDDDWRVRARRSGLWARSGDPACDPGPAPALRRGRRRAAEGLDRGRAETESGARTSSAPE